MNKIYLYLETGEEFIANSFGYYPDKPILSEIVFNTSMQGYQEVITDPSYCDQSIVMTYPLIGNYGIHFDHNESITPKIKSLIVKENCDSPSHYKSAQSLDSFLKSNSIPGIAHIDTRKLTKIIRDHGTMKSLICVEKMSKSDLKDYFQKKLPNNQIEKVSTKSIIHIPANGSKKIVMLDFGHKKSITESLLKMNFDVIIVPYNTSFEKINQFNPDGIVLSNGPGDPKDVSSAVPIIKQLQEKYPLMAICMGHQLFALANNADTHKMKFGHRGGNHPVINLKTKKVNITSQNHGYCVSEESIINSDLEITEVNLNDKTIEGLKHKYLPAFSVQYHPEASPGPLDTNFLFQEFLSLIKKEMPHA